MGKLYDLAGNPRLRYVWQPVNRLANSASYYSIVWTHPALTELSELDRALHNSETLALSVISANQKTEAGELTVQFLLRKPSKFKVSLCNIVRPFLKINSKQKAGVSFSGRASCLGYPSEELEAWINA